MPLLLRSICVLPPVRAVLLIGILAASPRAVAKSQKPAAEQEFAGVKPGERVRVLQRVPAGEAITAEPNRLVEGLLVSIDSASVALGLDDGTVRQFARSDVESVKVYAGRSHWLGLFAGWLAGLPLAAFVCRDAKYECSEGSAIGLVSGIAGAAIGWPRWQDVPFP